MLHDRSARSKLFGGRALLTALLLYVIGPLLLALTAVAYFTLWNLEADRERRMKEEIELVARAVSVPVARALQEGAPGDVGDALASVFRIDRVYGANVYDTDGGLLASFGRDPGVSPGDRRRVAVRGDRAGAYGQSGERRVYSYFVPLSDPGGRLDGLLEVMRRRRDIDAEVRRVRWQVGGVFLFCLLGVTGLVILGHRRAIGAHLARLSSDMARVAGRVADHRAAVGGPREIAEVAVELNGMLDRIAAAEREVSERRRVERGLEEKLRRTEQLAVIGQLAAGVAHELGAPLSVVDRSAQRVAASERLSPLSEAALSRIRREVGRMTRIVRQLLDYGACPTTVRDTVAVDRLARRAAIGVRDLAEERDVALELVGDTPAPRVRVDPVRCEHALRNLLQNALQAANEGGVVRLSWAAEGGQAIVSVDDDGPGVPEEVRGRLFEAFFTTKPPGRGAGLGLAVVQGVADELGGRVCVGDSELGGARFSLRLPVHAAEED